MSTERRTILASATFVWAMLVFCLFALIAIVWVRMGGPGEFYEEKRAQVRLANLKKLQDENRQKLETYAWADKQKGIVQIPIQRAMELAMAELKIKKVQASTVKVEVPYPAGLQQPPAPAPGASPAASSPAGTQSASPAATPTPSAVPAASAPAATPAATPTSVTTAPVAAPEVKP